MNRQHDKNKGRKGIGIELALLVLLVVFGLSALLVSTAMLEKNNLQQEKAALAQRIELDKLAEEFCDSENKPQWQPSEGPYTATVSADGCTLVLLLEEKPLLTVVLEASGDAYKVVQWTHH